MTRLSLRSRLRALARPAKRAFLQARILKYKALSFGRYSGSEPICAQPVLLMNNGQVSVGTSVTFGFHRSPGFWNTYAFVDCRSSEASIIFGKDIHINNGFSVICTKTTITIGDNCLIGPDVTIMDSDFHAIDPEARQSNASPRAAPVTIGDNVFIGSKCIILKGSVIGSHSVVGAGAVVSGKFPEKSLIGGNPAVLIRTL